MSRGCVVTLPSDFRFPISMPSVNPPCTKPTSTRNDGFASFSRLSRPPCEGRICTLTPSRSMRLRYLSAVVRNVLPSGPLRMTMVSSGAGRANLNATQATRQTNNTTGSTMTARSRQDTRTNFSGRRNRREARSGFFLSTGALSSCADAGIDDRNRRMVYRRSALGYRIRPAIDAPVQGCGMLQAVGTMKVADSTVASACQPSALFPAAGKGFAQRVFQHQPGRELEFVLALLQKLHECPRQLAAIHGVRNAKVAVDVVDLFFPMMEGMISLADVVPRNETVDEPYADAATEILHRVVFFRPAMEQHFFPGKAAEEPGCR